MNKFTRKDTIRFKKIVGDYKCALCASLVDPRRRKDIKKLADSENYGTQECLCDISNYENLGNYINESDAQIIDKVTLTLSLMDKEERELLLSEYFYMKEPNWWMGEYSRSTFYRRRSNAITTFLQLYGNKENNLNK